MISEHVSTSVIVPTYNRLSLLKQTLDCLRNQSLKTAEFLIVDDGSEHDTISHIEEITLSDNRFRLLRKPVDLRKGCQVSKNYALPHASGKYVVFLDSDDLLSPWALASRTKFLDENPEFDIAVGEQAVLLENQGIVRWLNTPRGDNDEIDRILSLTHPLDIPWVNGGIAIRIEALRRHGLGYRPEFRWEDAAFHFECICVGLRVGWMPRTGVPDSFYRIHGQSMGTDLWREDACWNIAQMLRWQYDMLQQHEKTTPSRLRTLGRDYFQLAILRAIDRGEFQTACKLVSDLTTFLSCVCPDRLARYIKLRRLVRWSRRLTWYVNRWFRRSSPDLFQSKQETYASTDCSGFNAVSDVSRLVPSYSVATEDVK